MDLSSCVSYPDIISLESTVLGATKGVFVKVPDTAVQGVTYSASSGPRTYPVD